MRGLYASQSFLSLEKPDQVGLYERPVRHVAEVAVGVAAADKSHWRVASVDN